MRKKFWIYKITNKVNGKFYIGQTNDISKRKSAHKLVKDEDTYISRSILKYGWSNHKFEILFYAENVEIWDANQIERYFIRFYNSCHVDNKRGMNLNDGGMQGLQTEEHLSRMVATKFFTWKKKRGKEGVPIEVYDKKTGVLIVSHEGTPQELFKILGMDFKERLTTKLTGNLKRCKGLFCKKYIVQWAGENKVAEYYERKSKEAERLRNSVINENRSANLRPRTDFSSTSTPVKELTTGITFKSIRDFAKHEGICATSVMKRFKKGKYDGRYSLINNPN